MDEAERKRVFEEPGSFTALEFRNGRVHSVRVSMNVVFSDSEPPQIHIKSVYFRFLDPTMWCKNAE